MTQSSRSGAPSTLVRRLRLAEAFATLAAIFVALWMGAQRLEQASGVDFYHIWGIAAAHKLSAEQLPNPYQNTEETASMLNDYVDTQNDSRLQRINTTRRTIDPTGTPWFYSTFSVLPLDFQRAHLIFFVAQHMLFAGAFLLLLRSLRIPWPEASFVTALAVVTFQPFAVDVRVGNVNTFQLLLLTSLAWGSLRSANSTWVGAVLMIGYCLVAAWKPNIALVSAFLMCGHLARVGVRRFGAELTAGIVVTGLFVVASATWFRDPGIWIDWYTYLYGANPDKLNSYPVVEGNLSTALVLSQLFGGSARRWTIGLCAGIGVTALLASVSGARMSDRSTTEYLKSYLTDTWLILAVGICITTAISPLMWRHYFTWAVVTPIWVLATRRRVDGIALLTIGTLVLYWEPPGLINLLGAPTLDALQSLAWMFSWIGLLTLIGNPVIRPAR